MQDMHSTIIDLVSNFRHAGG